MNTSHPSSRPLGALQFSLRRLFLYVHIVAVACSAFVGVGQILTGHDDDFRVLLTAISVALASVCGLGCGAAIEAKRVRMVAYAGLVLTFIALVLGNILIWFERTLLGDWYWLRTTCVVSIFSVACSHVSLLSMARLSRRFQWAFMVGVISIFSVAVLVAWPIILDHGPHHFQFRVIAVAAIIDATMTVLVPIFHLLSRSEMREAGASSLAELDAEIAHLETRLAELRTQRTELEGESVRR